MANFVISEAEYIEACRLFAHSSPKKVAISIASLIVAFAVVAPFVGLTWSGAIAGIIGGLVGIGLVAFVTRQYVLPRKARSLYRQHKALREEITFAWDDAGTCFSSALGKGTTPWSHYREVREGPSTFILLLTDNLSHIVPKPALGEQSEIDSFRSATDLVSI